METTKKRRGYIDEEAAPAERILSVARELFYAQGFPTTGVNQIIEESGTSKKSFYKYYPTKQELGSAYIMAEKNELISFFRHLSRKYDGYTAFIRTWCNILRKEAKYLRYHGCPFGNFASQVGQIDYAPQLTAVIEEWLAILEAKLAATFPDMNQADIARHSERILMLYEGAVTLWKVTGDMKYFNLLEEELLSLAP